MTSMLCREYVHHDIPLSFFPRAYSYNTYSYSMCANTEPFRFNNPSFISAFNKQETFLLNDKVVKSEFVCNIYVVNPLNLVYNTVCNIFTNMFWNPFSGGSRAPVGRASLVQVCGQRHPHWHLHRANLPPDVVLAAHDHTAGSAEIAQSKHISIRFVITSHT